MLDKWKTYWEAALSHIQKNQLKMILESGQMILFFRYKGDVFGAGEGSRVTFAKMKDQKDEDHTPGWLKEANFMATNLTKLGQGQQQQMIFGAKELPLIDIMTKDEAYNQLEEFFEKGNK
jgi:hypothetical protein